MKTDTKFRQKAKVGVAGSFMNQMMSNNDILPEVGKGATLLMYSDRSCYEVIEVSEDFKTVKLEALEAKADPRFQNGHGHQNWILEPTGNFCTVVWRHNAWRTKGTIVTFTKEFIEKAEKELAGKFQSYSKVLTEEQRIAVYAGKVRPQNVVPGITEQKTEYNKINLIFGRKDYYYDWSF